MIKQYTGSYNTPSTQIQNIVANSVSLLDKYVLVQTGDNEYTAIIKNVANGEVEQITISRSSGTGMNNLYKVERDIVDTFEYQITNEYYAISNVGKGQALSNIPSYNGILSYGMTAIVTLVFFAVIFKGVLFKCLKLKK